MEDSLTTDYSAELGMFCRQFEESEESTQDSRQKAERDRDYYDEKQWTAEEETALKNRKQPVITYNRVKRKVNAMMGLEKQTRKDPKAFPRNPDDEQSAQAATDVIRYACEDNRWDDKRSECAKELAIEGTCAIMAGVKQTKGGIDPELKRIPWDRFYYDPHSSEFDFADAAYLGQVIWMDVDKARKKWPDKEAVFVETWSQAQGSDTYDDKPKYKMWADYKRKRVRICQIWLKKGNDWHFAEFTKGGILKAGPSPYKTDRGESDCELFFQSAYVDRDNNRYGLVREMITLQDGINKRHSKALHLLNTVQITSLRGAVNDVEKARKEAARPDGWIEVNEIAQGGLGNNIKFETRLDLAAAQLQLLQEAKNSIDLKGPNATQMGDKTQGSSAASGKAILASQQGGMVSLGDLLDNLRHLDRRVFRAVWSRVRQYWTEEKWIRITDDERNIKWVGMNIDPEKMQQLQMKAQQNPDVANKIGGVMGSVAELDCDIIIDEVPDVIASQEQFGMLVDLKKMDANNELPFRALVQASSIKDKSKMLDEMDKAKQPNPQVEKLKMRGAVAEVAETESKVTLNNAKARQALTPDMPDQAAPIQQQDFEIPPAIQIEKALADIDYVKANTQNKQVVTALAPAKASHDAQISEAQLSQRAEQMRQPQPA